MARPAWACWSRRARSLSAAVSNMHCGARIPYGRSISASAHSAAAPRHRPSAPRSSPWALSGASTRAVGFSALKPPGAVAHFDVVIIGAGAAGMMAAIEAGKRGRHVLVLDHAAAPGEKIRISGGGRCNFTNVHTRPDRFLSANPRFAISALARYTPERFIDLVRRHGIAFHEKTLGQLFCDGSSRQIIDMLTAEMAEAGVTLQLDIRLERAERRDDDFLL